MSDQVQTQPAQTSERVGPLASPWTVEQAAVQSLQTWMWPSLVEEVERQNGLAYGTLPRIEAPQIRGAADMDEWAQDELPVILVVCLAPEGAPASSNSVGWQQEYALTVGVVTTAVDEEDLARRDASLLTAAAMGVIGNQFATDNPTIVSDLRLTQSPKVEFVDQDATIRLEWVGTVAFSVYVCPVLEQGLGLAEPVTPETVPDGWPTVTDPGVVITAVPDADTSF